MTDPGEPVISVVLIVRHPDDTPDAVLWALSKQWPEMAAEIILVDGRPEGSAPRAGLSPVKLIYIQSPGQNMPRLKAIGVEKARGALAAFLEPKGVPNLGWFQSLIDTHVRSGARAIGGSVIFSGRQTAFNRAAYLFEYGGFAPDEIRGGRIYALPGNNMALPRQPLSELCSDILEREGLNKPFCQKRLLDANVQIEMAPEMSVNLQTNYRYWEFIKSRYHYARCFGATRLRLASPWRWAVLVVGALLIPVLVVIKSFSRLRGNEGVKITPTVGLATFCICLAWAYGEIIGSWFGRGGACARVF
jgi:hypothetical protein